MKLVQRVGMCLLLSVACASAQQPTVQPQEVPVATTPLEQSRMESLLKDQAILQLKYQLAQAELSTLEEKFNDKTHEINVLVSEIKNAHKYGDDVVLNAQTSKLIRRASPKTQSVPVSKDVKK